MKDTLSDNIVFQKLSSLQAYDNNIDYHMHNCYEVYLLIDGDVNFYVHKSCYHITSSSLAIINNLEPHKFTNNRDSDFSRIYFHIPFSFTAKYSSGSTDLADCFTNRDMGSNNILLLTPSQEKYIIDIYTDLDNLRNSHSSFGRELLFDTYVIQLLVYIGNLYRNRVFTSPQKYSDDVQFIIEYIDSHLLENITLDSLAGKLSHDKYYISHKFKSETDTSILHYLILSRISKAKQLLLEGMNVTEACYNCGFNDYCNFITTFRKITGYSPKKYQQSFLGNKDAILK